MTEKTALITGGNRGIGLELCRQLAKSGYTVFMTARTLDKAKKEAQNLRNAIPIALDVDDPASIRQASAMVAAKTTALHLLVNNAGIYCGEHGSNNTLETPVAEIETSLKTNTIGPFLVCQAFIPLLQNAKGSHILNISSQMGQLSSMGGGYMGYRVSKTALNAMTLVLAHDLADKKISVNCLCPGWVKTDMGGKNAHLEVSVSVERIVEFLKQQQLPSGKFIQFGKEIAW